MRTHPHLKSAWQTLRASYWFVPSVMACLATGLAFGVLAIDTWLGEKRAGRIDWLYTGSVDGARAMLQMIGGSIITVAGTTFSITIAALSLASGQYGPRILRNFMRDTGNQIVLGTFIGTFVYCVLILRKVRGLDNDAFDPFVPHLAITVAIVLALASIAVLIYFIHHIAASIQASHIIATIARDLDEAIDRLYPEHVVRRGQVGMPPAAVESLPPRFAQESAIVGAPRTGYVRRIDATRLLAIAREHELVLRLHERPGRFVGQGRPLVSLWPAGRGDEATAGEIMGAFIIGNERTEEQDVGFPIDQLVEIAVRALSPGINDPFTALACVDYLGAALCKLAGRTYPLPCCSDDAGKLRVVAMPTAFVDHLDAACTQIRQYGQTSVSVTLRLLEMLGSVATCTRTEEQRAALRRQVERLGEVDPSKVSTAADREVIAAYYRSTLATLAPPSTGQ